VAFSSDGSRFAVRDRTTLDVLVVPSLHQHQALPVSLDPVPVPALFGSALGPDADLLHSDADLDRWRSPSGRTEVAGGRIIDVAADTSVPLSGGSGPGLASAFAFEDGDAVVSRAWCPTTSPRPSQPDTALGPRFRNSARPVDGARAVTWMRLGRHHVSSKCWGSGSRPVRARSSGPGCAELRNRGVRDALIVCCDGLTDFPEVVEATWPQTTVQTSHSSEW
jgi:hypothetical protein